MTIKAISPADPDFKDVCKYYPYETALAKYLFKENLDLGYVSSRLQATVQRDIADKIVRELKGPDLPASIGLTRL